MKVFTHLLPFLWKQTIQISSKRNFKRLSVLHNPGYEDNMKSTVTMLNKDETNLMINSYSQMGFRLNNNVSLVGPIAIFARTVLSWNVSSGNAITPESLELFRILEPKIEILVIGVGDKTNTEVSSNLINAMRKYKIALEILTTDQACTTFNFLNAEHRVVAAALVPPQKMKFTDDDAFRTAARQKEIYETD